MMNANTTDPTGNVSPPARRRTALGKRGRGRLAMVAGDAATGFPTESSGCGQKNEAGATVGPASVHFLYAGMVSGGVSAPDLIFVATLSTSACTSAGRLRLSTWYPTPPF